VPYAYLFVVGALKNMDPALEEAARTVSAGVVATMRRVTLPLMLPALLSSALLVFVLAAELFSVPAMLGARVQIHTIPTVIYFGFQYGNVPVGEVSALATMLLWVTAAGIFLYRRTVALSRRYVTVSGKGYRARPIELGPWRWAGWGLVTLYVLVAVVLPYLALLLGSFLRFLTPKLRPQSFTLDNYARITEPGTLVAIQNTLLLAVTILPVPIYGTIAMLLVAYMTRFIAYGVRIASSGLHQIDPELEEAGRLSGLSPLRAFRRIVLPLLRPSLISAWTLLFIFVVVEITATILLYTANTKTMAVVMWNAVEMAGSVGAFTLGVIQVTLVFGVLAGVYRVAGSLETGVG
jgi:iron(III) transport system permease protein